jgi:hypothetical protein
MCNGPLSATTTNQKTNSKSECSIPEHPGDNANSRQQKSPDLRSFPTAQVESLWRGGESLFWDAEGSDQIAELGALGHPPELGSSPGG